MAALDRLQNARIMQRMENDTLLTVKEAAERLSVSDGRVYQLIRCGDLPAYRIGRSKHGTLRIRASDVERALSPVAVERDE